MQYIISSAVICVACLKAIEKNLQVKAASVDHCWRIWFLITASGSHFSTISFVVFPARNWDAQAWHRITVIWWRSVLRGTIGSASNILTSKNVVLHDEGYSTGTAYSSRHCRKSNGLDLGYQKDLRFCGNCSSFNEPGTRSSEELKAILSTDDLRTLPHLYFRKALSNT